VIIGELESTECVYSGVSERLLPKHRRRYFTTSRGMELQQDLQALVRSMDKSLRVESKKAEGLTSGWLVGKEAKEEESLERE
jgi:hypothetical protein